MPSKIDVIIIRIEFALCILPGMVHANIPNARSANVTATALDPSTSSGDKIV